MLTDEERCILSGEYGGEQWFPEGDRRLDPALPLIASGRCRWVLEGVNAHGGNAFRLQRTDMGDKALRIDVLVRQMGGAR